jgi:hypothetical protein
MWIVSLYMGVVLGYMGTFGYDGASRLRGRQQVVIALSVPYNLTRSDIHVGVCKVSMARQTKPGDHPIHLTLNSTS